MSEQYCIRCKHLKLDRWNDAWPEFSCKLGGEMDIRSTLTLDCPAELELDPRFVAAQQRREYRDRYDSGS